MRFTILTVLFAASVFLLAPVLTLAEGPPAAAVAPAASPVAAPSASPVVAAQAPEADPQVAFSVQLVQTIEKFGGLGGLAKIAAILLLIVASVKVSFLNSLLWSKLGPYQSLVAPALGLVAGAIALFTGASPVSWASALGILLAYFGSGVGAVGLHELLDDIKELPGIGPTYVAIINAVESALGGGSVA